MRKTAVALLAAAFALPALAKLPPPSPEAKAKADEAKAKTAHGDKAGAYKLCLSQDRVVSRYLAAANPAHKAAPTACTDPGPFVYNPDGAAAPAAAAPAAPAAAAAAAAPPKKP